MTSNYRNSAGTDLDNLFYINNANLGAIGFKMSDGVDLGNRYANDQVLGYNVGYKNSAGTDIGYLRGQRKPYTHILTVDEINMAFYKMYGYGTGPNGRRGSISPTTFNSKQIYEVSVANIIDHGARYPLYFTVVGNMSSSVRFVFDNSYSFSLTLSYNSNNGRSKGIVATNDSFFNYIYGKKGSTVKVLIEIV